MAAKGKYKAVSLARMNRIIKLVHIPAYLDLVLFFGRFSLTY